MKFKNEIIEQNYLGFKSYFIENEDEILSDLKSLRRFVEAQTILFASAETLSGTYLEDIDYSLMSRMVDELVVEGIIVEKAIAFLIKSEIDYIVNDRRAMRYVEDVVEGREQYI